MNPKIKRFSTRIACLFFLVLAVGCSSPPDDTIVEAINTLNVNKNFTVQTWEQTNAYTRTIDDETKHYIEYQAEFKIKPEFASRVPANHSSYTLKGTLVLVKRGSEWYVLEN